MAELPRFLGAFPRREFCAFVRANRRTLWKIGYFALAALLFVSTAWKRFSLPQDPLADTDFGYLWPALMKLGGGAFAHIQGLNFLYPGMLYLVLRIGGDFRAISVIQHLLGLIAGALFLASWTRLADFFPKPRLNLVAHEAIGLLGASIYLLSNTPLFLEMRIRSDAVCMFFEMLVFWLTIQFLYHRVISPDARKTVAYGIAVTVNAFLLASLKPSFALMALFVVVPVIWLILHSSVSLTGKFAFFCLALSIIGPVSFAEHHLRRNDPAAKMFLPQTLFAIHAKIIQAQMAADLEAGETGGYAREWLRSACDDLGAEIQRQHELFPNAYPLLGFPPNHLMSVTRDNAATLLGRWRRELGDEKFLEFLNYWYWHTVRSRPLAIAGKIARELGVFYSINCPAISFPKLPLAPDYYSRSYSALSHPTTLRLLAGVPGGPDFLERTGWLLTAEIIVQRTKRIWVWGDRCAYSYLFVLAASIPLAGWFVLKRGSPQESKWAALLVLLFYAANFGNVLGISVVHSMEVDRYSRVLFIEVLFAELWAVRWMFEIILTKLPRAATVGQSVR